MATPCPTSAGLATAPTAPRSGGLQLGRLASLLLPGLAVAGCASPPPRPGAISPPTARTPYVTAEQLQGRPFPPPPAAGSAAQEADEAALLAWQGRRTGEDCARADRTFFVSFSHLWGESSPLPQPLPAEARDFFARVDAEIGDVARAMKARFRRPRPDPERACPSPRSRKGGGHSYPSTHAALSRVFGLVLADLVPERRAEFLARADAIAHDRLVIGVHYPTDLDAGKLLADQFHAALLASRDYRADLARIKELVAQAPEPAAPSADE